MVSKKVTPHWKLTNPWSLRALIILHPPHPHPSTVSWIHSRNFFEKDTVLACLHTANQPAGQPTAAWHSLAPQMFQMCHPNRLANKSMCVGDSTKVVFFRLGFEKTKGEFLSVVASEPSWEGWSNLAPFPTESRILVAGMVVQVT